MKKELPTLEQLYSCRPMAIWAQVRSEHIAFWLVCGYLLFEYVRPQSIWTFIDVLPWAAGLAVGSFFAAFLDRAPRPKGSPLNKLILMYGVVIILSALAAINPKLSFDQMGAYFNWVLIYFAIVLIVHTRERFFIFVLLYMLCNFKMTQHGFFSWASRGFSFSGWGVTGSPGWFHNSGEFGIQLTIFTPMIVAFCMALFPYWNRITKLFFFFMPLTAVGSTLATSSRGALLGLVAAGAWSMRFSKYFLRTAVVLAVVGSLAWFATPVEFKARFETAGEDRTSLHRLDRWEKAWTTMKEYPLLGVGHKNWDRYYRAKLDHYGPDGSAKVHNVFFESGTEHGFLGLFTLLALFGTMFVLNTRTRRIAKEYGMRFEYYMAHGMDGAIIGLVISASFITVLYYPYIWIHAAFVTCLYNSAKRGLPQAARYRRAEPQYG